VELPHDRYQVTIYGTVSVNPLRQLTERYLVGTESEEADVM
jgi:hypothetical protein